MTAPDHCENWPIEHGGRHVLFLAGIAVGVAAFAAWLDPYVWPLGIFLAVGMAFVSHAFLVDLTGERAGLVDWLRSYWTRNVVGYVLWTRLDQNRNHSQWVWARSGGRGFAHGVPTVMMAVPYGGWFARAHLLVVRSNGSAAEDWRLAKARANAVEMRVRVAGPSENYGTPICHRRAIELLFDYLAVAKTPPASFGQILEHALIDLQVTRWNVRRLEEHSARLAEAVGHLEDEVECLSNGAARGGAAISLLEDAAREIRSATVFSTGRWAQDLARRLHLGIADLAFVRANAKGPGSSTALDLNQPVN